MEQRLPSERKKLRRTLAGIPAYYAKETALYRHFDANDELLYVGVSVNPFERTGEHKLKSRWFKKITTIKIEWYENRDDAEDAEFLAIRDEKPKYNRTHNR